MPRPSLLDLFDPPEGYRGDFAWVCGFTADADVVEEMARRFTRGERRRRPALALFSHPTIPMQIRPGVLPLFRRRESSWDFNLLHAKVGLLHFTAGTRSLLRLIVSTGNWTPEPLGTSIDLFWSIEWSEGDRDRQAAADIIAAVAMFDWLRTYFDVRALEVPVGERSSESRLRSAIAKLPARQLPRPRFVDSRVEGLQAQIMRRLADEPAKRNRLILGSGYFEAGECADTGVLANFVRNLQDAGCLTRAPLVDVILNPDACQGLAAQASELRKRNWTLRPPASVEGFENAKLHAKFAFSAGGTKQCTNPWCYIGSGNLSRTGFTLAAKAGGNLEAGVFFQPEGYVAWGRDPGYELAERLPVDLERAVGELDQLDDGVAFAPLAPPPESPPVAYLVWENGSLSLPKNTGDHPALRIRLVEGRFVPLPAALPDPPSTVVLHPMGVEVPVLARNGFVLPPVGPKRVEDVLFELAEFPKPPVDERDTERASEIFGEEDRPPSFVGSGEYPLRRMMRLIVRLTERQAQLSVADWEMWTNRLQDLLAAIALTEEEMLDATRSYGIDPLTALQQASFCPRELAEAELNQLSDALTVIRKKWRFEGLEPLFPKEEAA